MSASRGIKRTRHTQDLHAVSLRQVTADPLGSVLSSSADGRCWSAMQCNATQRNATAFVLTVWAVRPVLYCFVQAEYCEYLRSYPITVAASVSAVAHRVAQSTVPTKQLTAPVYMQWSTHRYRTLAEAQDVCDQMIDCYGALHSIAP